MTSIVVDATYEDGVLKPRQPLPLREHEMVRITVESSIISPKRVLRSCFSKSVVGDTRQRVR